MTMSDEEKDYIAAPSPTEQMVASKPPRARVEDAVDPDEETADIDTSNNTWPKRKKLGEFEQFKNDAKGE